MSVPISVETLPTIDCQLLLQQEIVTKACSFSANNKWCTNAKTLS